MQTVEVDATVNEGEDFSCVGLALRPDASNGRTPILQADCTGWSLAVYQKGSATAIYTASGNVTDTNSDDSTAILVDTLTGANDGFWGLDADGRNFRHFVKQTDLAAASATLQGGRRYRFVYVLSTSAYGNVPLIFNIKIRSNLTF